jgi:hypothetical protein
MDLRKGGDDAYWMYSVLCEDLILVVLNIQRYYQQLVNQSALSLQGSTNYH